MVLSLCKPNEGVKVWESQQGSQWEKTVRKQTAWHQDIWTTLALVWRQAGCILHRQQGSGRRVLMSASVHHKTSLKPTRQSPGGFVPCWHQICSHRGKFLSEQENEAVASWIQLGTISRAGYGESVAEKLCRLWGGTAKCSPVFILFVTCITLLHLSEGLELPWVVRGFVQSLRAYSWTLRWTRQLVEGMPVSWNVGVRPETCLSLAVWGDYLVTIKPEQFFMS